MKFRGASILYALMVTGLLSCTMASFFIYDALSTEQEDRMKFNLRLLENVRSGISLGCTISGNQETDLFDTGMDSVSITSTPWGLFKLVHSRAHHGDKYHELTALVGCSRSTDQYALYVTNNGRGINVCGQTRVIGPCRIGGSFNKVHIEGYSFTGEIPSPVLPSENQLPSLSPELVKNIEDLQLGFHPEECVEVSPSEFIDGSFSASFAEPPSHWKSNSSILISTERIEGHVIISSPISITIEADCHLDNVLIVAPKVTVMDGFNGRIQIFASEQIILDPGAHLKYPSCAVLNSEGQSAPENVIHIQSGSTVEGTILALSGSEDVIVKIDEDALVVGEVVATGLCQTQGSILGSLSCEGLWLTTNSGKYEDHLLNAKIDLSGRSNYFVGPALTTDQEFNRIVKWL